MEYLYELNRVILNHPAETLMTIVGISFGYSYISDYLEKRKVSKGEEKEEGKEREKDRKEDLEKKAEGDLNPKELSLERINLLVEQSFGKGFKGNWTFAFCSPTDGHEGMNKIEKPCLIGRKYLLGFYRYAGQLGNEYGPESDGSVIIAFPKFKEKAKKYAELYRQKTGKPAKVIMKDYINPAEDFGFVPKNPQD